MPHDPCDTATPWLTCLHTLWLGCGYGRRLLPWLLPCGAVAALRLPWCMSAASTLLQLWRSTAAVADCCTAP